MTVFLTRRDAAEICDRVVTSWFARRAAAETRVTFSCMTDEEIAVDITWNTTRPHDCWVEDLLGAVRRARLAHDNAMAANVPHAVKEG